MRLLFIEENPAPYRDETLEQLLKMNVELRIFTEFRTTAMDNHNEWDYSSPLDKIRFYSGKTYRNRFGAYRTGFIKQLKEFKPSVICSGSLIECFLGKLFAKARIVYRSDLINTNACEQSKLKKQVLRLMMKPVDAIWVPGNAGEKAYRYLSNESKKIYQGAYTYDACRIWKQFNFFYQHRYRIRKEYGIENNEYVFLFVGKLIPTRHIEVLCKSFAGLLEKRQNVELVVCGDGPEEYLLNQYFRLNKNVVKIKRVKLNELEKLYAISDVYIHPGEEPYSLALYEAAICGLPIIASEKVGAVSDCMVNNNGIKVHFCDVNDYIRAMDEVIEHFDEFSQNAVSVHEYIMKERGTKWSSSELLKACMGNKE